MGRSRRQIIRSSQPKEETKDIPEIESEQPEVTGSKMIDVVKNTCDVPIVSIERQFDIETVAATNLLMDSERGKYNPEIAQLMATLSGWSYSNLNTFQAMVGGSGFLSDARYKEISIRNDALFLDATVQLLCTKDMMIVCFRGTEPLKVVNYITDASVKKEYAFHRRFLVHSGFWQHFRSVWYGPHGALNYLLHPELMMMKNNNDHAPKKRNTTFPLKAIYITGHSLGGALAQLAAMELQDNKDSHADLWRNLRGVYTFGQPMVVDDWQRKECHDCIGHLLFRHVYQNDLVPHLPPLASGGFDHVGSEYRYENGEWVPQRKKNGWLPFVKDDRATQVVSLVLTLPVLLADFALWNTEWVPSKLLPLPWSLSDHNPRNYMSSPALKN